ncbi:hypothetical protein EDC01DRAFT_635850 [Geopyxis carbonaria]|nr:hypothetical protein EDC01DRAFT_635850 [Geopyxis carbonaria]
MTTANSGNMFPNDFSVYDFLDPEQLNSALGHLVVQHLLSRGSGTGMPTDSPPDTIPAIVWAAVQHSNQVQRPGSVSVLLQQPQGPTVTLFRCLWMNCRAVFDTRTKLRRHTDLHKTPPTECPLCPTGGRLWLRVDKLQTHLLTCHWPFDLDDVRDTIQQMYRDPAGGRGWFDRMQLLLCEDALQTPIIEIETVVKKKDVEDAKIGDPLNSQ